MKFDRAGKESDLCAKISRRSLVATGCVAAAGALLGAPLISCSRRPVLRVANWADLIGPTTIEDFQRIEQCDILYENYSSNEELQSKLIQRPDAYDVVFPSDYMVDQLASRELLMRIDRASIGNFGALDPKLLGHGYDPNNTFSFPYVFWGTGLAINRKRFQYSGSTVAWEDLFADAVAGRVTVLDEMRYTLGMALIMRGYSVNSKDKKELDRAVEALQRLKPRLLAFVTDVKDYLISGEAAISYAYSGDVYQASRENPDVTFEVPASGGIVGIDNMCITARCKNPDLAHRFLNYLLRPEVAADVTKATYYASANKAARDEGLVPKDVLGNPAIYIPSVGSTDQNVLRDLGVANGMYVNAWNAIKSS